MKCVYLRSLLETLAMLGWFEKKHLPMRERALVAVNFKERGKRSSGFGISRSFSHFFSTSPPVQIAAKDGLLQAIYESRKRGKDGPSM